MYCTGCTSVVSGFSHPPATVVAVSSPSHAAGAGITVTQCLWSKVFSLSTATQTVSCVSHRLPFFRARTGCESNNPLVSTVELNVAVCHGRRHPAAESITILLDKDACFFFFPNLVGPDLSSSLWTPYPDLQTLSNPLAYRDGTSEQTRPKTTHDRRLVHTSAWALVLPPGSQGQRGLSNRNPGEKKYRRSLAHVGRHLSF